MKKAFTLLEVVFSLGILGFLIAGFVLSFMQFAALNETNTNSTIAMNEAQSRLEELRSINDSTKFSSSCTTEARYGTFAVLGLGTQFSGATYTTLATRSNGACADRVFDARAVVCWTQTGGRTIGTKASNICVNSPCEVRTSIATDK